VASAKRSAMKLPFAVSFVSRWAKRPRPDSFLCFQTGFPRRKSGFLFRQSASGADS
jgi:hypothetical protein